MEIVFQTPSKNAIISFDREKNVYVCKLSGVIETMEEYKKIFNTFLDIYPYDKFPHLVFDNMDLKNDPALGRAWFATYAIPEFKKRIVDETKPKMAVVEPKNLFQNTIVKVLVKMAKQMGFRFNLKMFSNIDEAMAWVSQN